MCYLKVFVKEWEKMGQSGYFSVCNWKTFSSLFIWPLHCCSCTACSALTSRPFLRLSSVEDIQCVDVTTEENLAGRDSFHAPRVTCHS